MRAPRAAFTLFELILAIALSATLMVLIGAAINLYLLQVDASRTRIEEAQLARSILSTIAADIRAVAVYQTQDTSAVSQLAASAATFDVDDIDQSGAFTGGATTATGSTTGTGGASVGGYSGGASQSGVVNSTALAPGLNGTIQELILDVTRLPRLDELLPPATEQRGIGLAQSAGAVRPSDAKSVRYFLRQGSAVESSDAATTSLAPEAQLQVGGLVRQSIDRAVRDMAEQTGNTDLLNGGQVLVAPEVVHIEFRYFDGTAAVEEWIMSERQTMPPAVEVRIWLADGDADAAVASRSMAAYGTLAGPPDGAHMFSQTVDLPMSQSAAAGATDTTATDAGTEDFASGGGDTSAFGE